MRRYLSPTLRKHFNVAWHLLPAIHQARLRPFIRVVRQVPTLVGAKFTCADGSAITSTDEDAAYFGCDGTAQPLRTCLFLTDAREAGPGDFTIASILHELAHGVHYLDWDYIASQMDDAPVETYCWLQAGAWAAQSRHHFHDALAVATKCLQLASREWASWTAHEFLAPSSPPTPDNLHASARR